MTAKGLNAGAAVHQTRSRESSRIPKTETWPSKPHLTTLGKTSRGRHTSPKPLTCGSSDSSLRQLSSLLSQLFSTCAHQPPRPRVSSPQLGAPPNVSRTTGTGGHGERWCSCGDARLPSVGARTPSPASVWSRPRHTQEASSASHLAPVRLPL